MCNTCFKLDNELPNAEWNERVELKNIKKLKTYWLPLAGFNFGSALLAIHWETY